MRGIVILLLTGLLKSASIFQNMKLSMKQMIQMNSTVQSAELHELVNSNNIYLDTIRNRAKGLQLIANDIDYSLPHLKEYLHNNSFKFQLDVLNAIDNVRSLMLETQSNHIVSSSSKLYNTVQEVVVSLTLLTSELRHCGLQAKTTSHELVFVANGAVERLFKSLNSFVWSTTDEIDTVTEQLRTQLPLFSRQDRVSMLDIGSYVDLSGLSPDHWLFGILLAAAMYRLWICADIVFSRHHTAPTLLARLQSLFFQGLLPISLCVGAWSALMIHNEMVVAVLQKDPVIFYAAHIVVIVTVLLNVLYGTDRGMVLPKTPSGASTPRTTNPTAPHIVGMTTEVSPVDEGEEDELTQQDIASIEDSLRHLQLGVKCLLVMVVLLAVACALAFAHLYVEVSRLQSRVATMDFSIHGSTAQLEQIRARRQQECEFRLLHSEWATAAEDELQQDAIDDAESLQLKEQARGIDSLEEMLMLNDKKQRSLQQQYSANSDGGGGGADLSGTEPNMADVLPNRVENQDNTDSATAHSSHLAHIESVIAQLSSRVNQLSNQYNVLTNSQLLPLKNDVTQLSAKHSSLRQEVYSLNNYIIHEVRDHFNKQFDDRLREMDESFIRQLNEQMEAMDKYVITVLNSQVATVHDHLSNYVNEKVTTLDHNTVQQLNDQMRLMDEYVVQLINSQVKALDKHIHSKLVEMVDKYEGKIAALESASN